MSETTSEASGEVHRIAQIPSLLTSSLRELLETFGEDIIRLQAHGSVETTNRTAVDDLRQYGVSREQQTNQRLAIEYEQLHGESGPVNPLTSEACERIISELDAVLDTDRSSVDPDLTVTSMLIRITEERLEEVTRAQSAEFDLLFVADPAEPPLREPTKRLNARRGLYSDLGFNITNLNLRSVIETEAKYHQQSDGQYLSWGGPDDIRPRTPDRLAIRINDHVLPDTYGMLKPYQVTDDSVLEVAESNLDDIADRTVATGDIASRGEE